MEVHQNLNPNPKINLKDGYATSDLKMATPNSDLIMETPTPIEVVAMKRRLSGDSIALGVTKIKPGMSKSLLAAAQG